MVSAHRSSRCSPSWAAVSIPKPPTSAPTWSAKSKREFPKTIRAIPAVIADLVGDNVGDCAGRGADLFESTAAENIGAMILGVGLVSVTSDLKGILFPLVARAFGLVASIVGIMIVKCREDEDPMDGAQPRLLCHQRLAMVGFFFSAKWLLRSIRPSILKQSRRGSIFSCAASSVS